MKKQIRLTLIALSVVVPGVLDQAVAQISVPAFTFNSISGPVLANPGEHLLFCMDGHHLTIPITATLQILEAVTGAVVAQKQITLPPAASVALPPDPCLEYAVPASITSTAVAVSTSASAAPRPLYLGVVSLNPQPLPPGSLAASIQVFTPGLGGVPVNIRYIPIPVHPPDPCFL